ncbi:hypothetical protein LJC47_06800, partial [Desulfosarcina sp. OttesenSCG-928-B08]|nr:hypothetical protein [Desulfosarcina sp. OttesenSCG-928-B08]
MPVPVGRFQVTAIAYDALQEKGMAGQWGRVLDRTMRLQSIMFILTMTLGAAVYDAGLMSRLAAVAGWTREFLPEQTLRLPLYFTLVLAVLCVIAVLGLDEICPPATEPSADCKAAHPPDPGTVGAAIQFTLATGRWILNTPFVLAVML